MYKTLNNDQLLAIANEYGSPVYVYDAGKIADQYHKLTTAFKDHPTRFSMLVKHSAILTFLSI